VRLERPRESDHRERAQDRPHLPDAFPDPTSAR
jgi:hypothetical protein